MLSCFNTNFTKGGQFSIKLCKTVRMVTWTLISFDNKLLDEIIRVQSLIVLSMKEYVVPAYVLKNEVKLVFLHELEFAMKCLQIQFFEQKENEKKKMKMKNRKEMFL